MLKIADVQGVIFDVDDTLLDNCTRDPLRAGHERARLAAFHEVGRRRNLAIFTTITAEENHMAFPTSPVHSLEGAVWNLMFLKGMVPENIVDRNHDLFNEVVSLKDEFYEKILREEVLEIPGATAFVQALANQGLSDKMAVASSAVRRDILIFFEKTGLDQLIPGERIISKDLVTHPKPHPEVFERAFATLGLPPHAKTSVLVFEDDPRGIKAAKAAGLPVCAITSVYDRGHLERLEVAPDLVADSYAEFAELLGLPVD